MAVNFDEHGPAYPEPKTDYQEVIEPTELPFWARLLMAAFVSAVITCMVLLFSKPAHAINHGYDPNDKAVQWFESLYMQERLPMKVSCCGRSDSYPVDRYEILPNGDYKVWVEDGSVKLYPDGKHRAYWNKDIPIIVPKKKVNPMEDDLNNPTDHGWIFFNPHGNPGDHPLDEGDIYCFVPHPQGN
jgi:hypothetical protein